MNLKKVGGKNKFGDQKYKFYTKEFDEVNNCRRS